MMHGKRVTPTILFRKVTFGILILLVVGMIGVEPIEAAIDSQSDNHQFNKNSAIFAEVLAFPGAEGFGATTPGGRGGQVIEVTNLNDSGPGSLRAAIQARGPRIVVFRVGGTIELQSGLTIKNPFITIAGQTAPGGGITLKLSPDDLKALMSIRTHDVVIRYLRFRPGASTLQTSVRDAITMPDAYNVIIDHSSFSWATDENIDVWNDSHDITIQWSIISEGLRDPWNDDSQHSMGALLGSQGSKNISVHHNLFAHNHGRNPRVNTAGVVDIVNNVIYNPGDQPTTVANQWHPATPVNYVGNYYKKGSDSIRNFFIDTTGDPAAIFVQGNITPGRPTDDLDEVEGVVRDASLAYVVENRHEAPPITETSAFEAYDQVLANAGATLPLRDSVDERVVSDVINGTGNIINDPFEVGSWPELVAGTPPQDSDHDGMPDDWEILYGFDPNDPSNSSADADGDGYTNVEEYLNGTEPTVSSIPPTINDPTPIPEPTVEPTLETFSDPISLEIVGPLAVASGETFEASIVARNITNDGLYGVQLELNYDPSLISASSLQLNPNLSFVVLNSADNGTGKIRLVASQQGDLAGLIGDVTLLTFDATTVGTLGTATFDFENVKLSDAQADSLDFVSQSHAISIEEASTPEPTQEPTPEPTIEPTAEPTSEPTQEPTPEPTTEPTPEPTIEPTAEPTSEPTQEPTTDPTTEPTPEPTTEPTQEPIPEPTTEPTTEPTPEPTAEPTVSVIFGQVILAGRSDNNWSQATIVIDDNGQNGTTDVNGNFTITNVTYGVYNSITADAPGYLSAVCSQPTVQSVETALGTVALLSGDINDDNLIDITDATAVGAAFGQTGQGLLADINHDQILDIFDIVLVSVNFGLQGPTNWNCMAN